MYPSPLTRSYVSSSRKRKLLLSFRQVGSKEAHDPRRGDASRVAELVLLSRWLLDVDDSRVDGEREREREREHNEHGNVVAVRPRSNGERDGERAEATGNHRRGSTVRDVPSVQRAKVRAEDQHDREHRQRWPRGEEQAERKRQQPRARQ